MKMRARLLMLLVAYFGGAISMLFFLTPGEVKLDEKLRAIANPETRQEVVSFRDARSRVSDATDNLVKLIRQKKENDS